jgi:hypothetical protein
MNRDCGTKGSRSRATVHKFTMEERSSGAAARQDIRIANIEKRLDRMELRRRFDAEVR